jgi:ankyrin repeat protein
MMRTLVFLVALGLQAGCAASGLTPAEEGICANAPSSTYAPSTAPTQSSDPLLRVIFETGDPAKLKPALASAGNLDAQRGTTGITALSTAASAGNLAAAQLLVEAGASLEAKSRSGDTALESAMTSAQATTSCWLLRRGAASPDPQKKPYLVPAAALSEDFAASHALVRLLLNRGFSPDARMNGDTALHIAAELGNTELVRLLVQHGADVSAKNTRGETPLAVATRSGQKAVAPLLRPTPK